MNQKLSEKISIGGLCCAMIVVLRHSLNLKAFFGSDDPANWVAAIELFISKMTEMAVPYFFIISGYFFFKRNYYSWDNYKDMIIKKTRTLLVPYICWVIIGHIIMVPVGLGYLPETLEGIALAFWNAECAGVLWYVRSLIIMMILYPLYGWIFVLDNKFVYLAITVAAFLLWIPVDMRPLSTEGILFFLIGGIAQKYRLLGRYEVNKYFLVFLTILWGVCSYFSLSFDLWPNRINTIIGIIVIWFALDLIKGKTYKLLLQYSSFAFFLYVAHIYILKLLKFIAAYFFYGSSAAAIISFLLLPLLTVCVIIPTGIFLINFTPAFFSIITGGRGYNSLNKC